MADLSYSVDQIEQLLRCPVCLDRYRDPKSLPCQHTFCLRPCLEGLFDQSSRSIRCPECRAEHRLPHRGISGLPNNLTILRFLDLPLPRNTTNGNPSSPTITSSATGSTSNCSACNNSGALSLCAHCDRQVCEDCKRSHAAQCHQEISRLLIQIRRGLPRLSASISATEQKVELVKQKCESVSAEIQEAIERLIKDLKGRQLMLKSELNTFLLGEQRSLRLRQEFMELEAATVASFCDSTEAMIRRTQSDIPLTELLSIRQKCLDHLEALRNYASGTMALEPVTEPRFVCDTSRVSVSDFGELVVHNVGTSSALHPSIPEQSPSLRPTLPNGEPANFFRHEERENGNEREFQRRDVSQYLRRLPDPDTNAFNDNANSSTGQYSYSSIRATNNSRLWENPSQAGSRGRRRTLDRNNSDRMAGFLGASFNSTVPQNISHPVVAGLSSTEGRRRWNRNSNIRPIQVPLSETPDNNSVNTTLENPRQNEVRSGRNNDDLESPTLSTNRRGRDNNNLESLTRSVNRSGRDNGNAESPTRSTNRRGRDNDNSESPTRSLNRRGRETEDGQMMADSRSQVAAAPVLVRPPVRFDITIDDSIMDLTDDLDNTITFRYSTGDSNSITTPRNNYNQKGRSILRFGKRGNGNTNFTWPRGVTVHPTTNDILVADSSNHRIQVFDDCGEFVRTIGSYGQGDGEMDCLAGVAVNPEGEIVISDRYNHRIQIFDSNGSFKSKFGEEGTEDGQLNYPWGVACDSQGNIFVCDKENHRVQVFRPDGTFVRKFGRLGSGQGMFENPNYVAISRDNKVYVSDSSNHRVQVFEENGDFLFSFGVQGTQRGQMKFPKGIAVDDQGFVLVADSGNNRLQIFRQNGRYYCMFGSWGSQNGQFKGLEGVAIMPNGNVVVSDRENHRIQVF